MSSGKDKPPPSESPKSGDRAVRPIFPKDANPQQIAEAINAKMRELHDKKRP